MGNCTGSTSEEAETMRMRLRSSRNRLESTHQSLRSRYQAVEGTLFLYRSIVLRNYLNAQMEASKMIEKVEKNFATFALKRQKTFESVMKKIEEQRQVLHEKGQNLHLKANKKDAQNALSSAYELIDDVGDLIKLEDLLQGEHDAIMIKEKFEEQFKKYGIDMEQIEEMAYLLDLQINKIDMTKSQFVKKSDLPFALTTPQTSNT